MSKRGKILVAMSGGIDSTVTAKMLHDEGYEVIGVTMKTWDYASSGGSKKETGCCSLDSINDARQMAVDAGFTHMIIDIREEFGDYVIDDFVSEYMSGRTPNPCVLCNTHIKWEALLKRADAMDCEFIATGHYANMNEREGRYYVSKGKDENKDQSYVLWGLSQECMSRTKFPMGKYHKSEIKQMARDWGYVDIANKPESFEICFVPDNDYRGFLSRKVEDIHDLAGGKFVDIHGNEIGKHNGYPFYTIGQRKGLGQAFGKPMYVTQIQPDSNTVVLGEEDDLNRMKMTVHDLNWQKFDGLPIDQMESKVKIRYKHSGEMGVITQNDEFVSVDFAHDVKGIAPGQSAVFYDGNDVIGGGRILESYR